MHPCKVEECQYQLILQHLIYIFFEKESDLTSHKTMGSRFSRFEVVVDLFNRFV